MRFVLSWSFYWLGDLVWRIGDLLCRGHLPGWYSVYRTFMCWAHSIQGNTDKGPWRKTNVTMDAS